MAQLRVEELSASVSGHPILDSISFTIETGQWVMLRGRSGAGKTTLLDAMAGYHPLDKGAVYVDASRLDTLSEPLKAARRQMSLGYLSQSATLWPSVTVKEHITLAQTLSGKPLSADDKVRRRHMIESLYLQDVADRLCASLSGGEKRRVALLTALWTEPTFLLLDEPTTSLDDASALAVMDLLDQYVRDGHGLLMVTHDAARFDSAHRHFVLTPQKKGIEELV